MTSPDTLLEQCAKALYDNCGHRHIQHGSQCFGDDGVMLWSHVVPYTWDQETEEIKDRYQKRVAPILAIARPWIDSEWKAMIERSGFDISICRDCNAPVVCLPDGLSNWCEDCGPEQKDTP